MYIVRVVNMKNKHLQVKVSLNQSILYPQSLMIHTMKQSKNQN
jgi:hypothetical protein